MASRTVRRFGVFRQDASKFNHTKPERIPKMKVLLHVNYHEGPGKMLEELFALAERNGCDGVELRWKYRFDDRTQAEYREEVVRLKHLHPDMDIVFGACVDFCRGDQETVEREISEFIEFMAWAKAHCGSTLFNFFTGGLTRKDTPYHEFEVNGSGMAEEGDFERSAAGLRTVGDAAAKLGIRLALETHNNYLHDLVPACRKLMDMTNHPAVGLNFDQGNIALNPKGGTVDSFFEALSDKVYYAHLKNVQVVRGKNGGGYFITRLEEGCINQRRVMELLKKHLQGGVIAIEYPCPGDSITAAKRDMNYLRELLSEI